MNPAIIRALPLAFLAALYAIRGEWSTAWAWGWGVIVSLVASRQERLVADRQYLIAVRHALEVARREARRRPPNEATAIREAALEIAKLADETSPSKEAPSGGAK